MNNLFISESSQSSDDFKIILVELKSLSSVQLEADADFAKLLYYRLSRLSGSNVKMSKIYY
ncbi:uncharacterized protein LOC143021931 isoform X4 [Oratosquilla oratoria]|uniref:uncharacterized protein LOC143021931 isoform X4 n=1 Tax=Oratosquilla oratoria TaxID=337810 RepID=UPI003F76F37A